MCEEEEEEEEEEKSCGGEVGSGRRGLLLLAVGQFSVENGGGTRCLWMAFSLVAMAGVRRFATVGELERRGIQSFFLLLLLYAAIPYYC